MHVVMGATGHVGSAVVNALLAKGEAVTICIRHGHGDDGWTKHGVAVAIADVENVESLRMAFRRGKRAFLLNPPADISGDTNARELRTIRNILDALDGSGLEKVVAASTYGARPGDAVGDLSTLWTFEEGLRHQPIPAAIQRGAFYMTNWVDLTDEVRKSGKLPTMFPADLLMPMVAPADLGAAAAKRLLEPVDAAALRHVERLQRYTPQDVADAFAAVLGRPVGVEVAPRDQWEGIYKRQGFSDAAARAYMRMTAVSVDEGFEVLESVERGRVTLREFLATTLA